MKKIVALKTFILIFMCVSLYLWVRFYTYLAGFTDKLVIEDIIYDKVD